MNYICQNVNIHTIKLGTVSEPRIPPTVQWSSSYWSSSQLKEAKTICQQNVQKPAFDSELWKTLLGSSKIFEWAMKITYMTGNFGGLKGWVTEYRACRHEDMRWCCTPATYSTMWVRNRLIPRDSGPANLAKWWVTHSGRDCCLEKQKVEKHNINKYKQKTSKTKNCPNKALLDKQWLSEALPMGIGGHC